jgi:ABC-type sugar transport system permease subunit
VAPALGAVGLVALFPLAWTLWESLHVHDLRMPWLGRPFVGLANYAEAFSTPRFWEALGHTAFFAAASVSLELGLGLLLALVLHRRFRGRGLARTAALLPWAIPTVVAALVWRFLFEGPGAPAGALVRGLGLATEAPVWLAHPLLAWVPLVLADVWKTTPFVALLLLAGLQAIDPELTEAARVDGASAWQRFRHVTWPLLRPALAVALVFRSLDALRVFDLVYVLTGGGPGTATEPLALYAFQALLHDLRFGYGSALSMLLFAAAFALALAYLRLARRALLEDAP